MKKAAPKIKRKKMASGGDVAATSNQFNMSTADFSKWNKDQKSQFDAITDPAEKQKFYDNINDNLPAGDSTSPLTSTSAIGALNKGVQTFVPDTGGGKNADGTTGANTGKDIKNIASDTATGAEIGSIFPGLGTVIGGAAGLLYGIGDTIAGNNKRNKANQGILQQNAINKAGQQQYSVNSLATGGQVKGPGGPTDDLVETTLPAGSFVVPAKNAKAAIGIRKQYLGEKSSGMKKGGTVPVALSNGEHVFTPEEVKYLGTQGVKLDALAPEASEAYAKRNGGKIYLKPKAGAKQVTNAQMPELKAMGGLVQKLSKGTPPEGVQPVTADKDVEDAYGNPKVQAYLKGLMSLEADPSDILGGFNRDTMATGAFQFKPTTRDEILKESGYDAWSKDLKEQQKAAIYLIKKRGGIDAVKKGDFTNADKQLKGTWPSLPGGKEPNKNLKNLESVRGKSLETATPTSTFVSTGDKSKDELIQSLQKFQESQPKSKGGIFTDPDWNKKYWNYMDAQAKSEFPNLTRLKPEDRPEITPDILSTLDKDTNSPDFTRNADGSYTQKSADEPIDKTLTTLPQKSAQPTIADLINSRTSTIDPTLATRSPDADPTKTPPVNPGQNVFDKLGGWGGMAALAQTGFGLANLLSIGKRPIGAVDPVLLNRRDQAIADNHLNPAVKDAAENNIELTRRSTVNYNTNASGGDAGTGVAGAMQAQTNANAGYLNLAALQEQELAGKNARADALTGQVAGYKRQIFQDKLSAFEQNQQASGALLHAGISNFIGNLDYKAQLEQMRARDKLYNNPQSTVPVVQP